MAPENPVVRDFIIPLARYPHLLETKTLSDAVEVLLSFTFGENERLRYSAVLVINDKNQLVGRATLQDLLRGLDKHFAVNHQVKGFEGKSTDFRNLAILWEDSFFAECSKKMGTPLKDVMSPVPLLINADDPLVAALSIMLHTNDWVLPVVEEGAIIGVIRLEEIFKTLCSCCRL